MSLFGLSREEKAYKEFFEKTGVQITDEPTTENNQELDDEIEELYFKSRTHPKKSIPRLQKLIKKHPNIPSLKNFLYAAYTLSKQMTKAKALLEDTVKKHPKYIFGITNTILNIKDPEELKQHEHLLGNPKDIREFEGYDKPIHISAFKNYQAAVAHFETIMGNEKTAIERLDTLIELKVEKEFIDQVADRIAMHRMLEMTANLAKINKGKIDAQSKQTVFLDKLDIAPILNHSILDIFYKKSISEFSEEDITPIESLPRETLIADLENILEDSIRRWDEFQSEDYQESSYEFSFHALYWLGALKSVNSLEKVLNLLRMDGDFIDYWMADWYEDLFYPTLYYLGESQFDQLKNFVLEDDIYPYYRLLATNVVAQVAIQQPTRRDEAVQWFQSVFDFLLKNPNNKSLIDTNFIGLAIGNMIDFRGKELLETIEALYKKGWIHKNMQGDFEKIKESINEPFHESEIKPLPLNIQEFYSKKYNERKVKSPPLSEEDKQKFEELINPITKAGQLVSEIHTKLFSSIFSRDEPSFEDDLPFLKTGATVDTPETFVRSSKKVGRNDPCPCGSGKKYKKCCINK